MSDVTRLASGTTYHTLNAQTRDIIIVHCGSPSHTNWHVQMNNYMTSIGFSTVICQDGGFGSVFGLFTRTFTSNQSITINPSNSNIRMSIYRARDCEIDRQQALSTQLSTSWNVGSTPVFVIGGCGRHNYSTSGHNHLSFASSFWSSNNYMTNSMHTGSTFFPNNQNNNGEARISLRASSGFFLGSVISNNATNITDNSASITGNVTSLGNPNPTQHGHVWSTTTTSPTISLSTKTTLGSRSSTGIFESSMTDLEPWTLYYIRAYATNEVGTTYSSHTSFRTQGIIPTLEPTIVSEVQVSSARLTSSISNLGVPNPSQHGFQWSLNNFDTIWSTNNLGSTSSTGEFSMVRSSLSNNTVYYVRSYAVNSQGTAYGEVVEFRTHQTPAVSNPVNFADITTDSATATGIINRVGYPHPQHGHVWSSTTSNPTINLTTKTALGPCSLTGSFESQMTELEPWTLYYVRTYASNEAGTVYSSLYSFRTQGIIPTLEPTIVNEVQVNNVRVTSSISNLGVPNLSQHGFQWSLNNFDTIWSTNNLGSTSSTGEFSMVRSSLSNNTVYYVRSYAVNSQGTTYGEVVEFRTHQAPLVSTGNSVYDLNTTSAKMDGDVTRLGYPHPSYGHVWSTSSNPTINLPTKTSHGIKDVTGPFTSEITEMEPNTLYYIRSYAENDTGVHYGEQRSFITHSIPILHTVAPTIIDGRFVNVGGNISIVGGKPIEERGIACSTSTNPIVNDDGIMFICDGDCITNSSIPSSFSMSLELEPVTTYYARAYAINEYGIGYGNEIEFTTTHKPTVTTLISTPQIEHYGPFSITGSIDEDISQDVRYKVLVNSQDFISWSEYLSAGSSFSETLIYDNDYFVVGLNTITILAENVAGYIRSLSIHITITNHEPTLEIINQQDTGFRTRINDVENDKVRYRVFLNNHLYRDWSEWLDAGIEIHTSWDSQNIIIGGDNTFKIEFQDDFSVHDTQLYEYSFDGAYKNLLFLGTDNQAFSDDQGNTLEEIDLGETRAGQKSEPKKIYLKNTLDIPMENITIQVVPERSQRHSLYLLSKDELDFQHSILFSEVLSPGEDISFYVKVQASEADSSWGSFRLRAYGIQSIKS